VQEVTQELSTVTENSAPAAALHSWLGVAYAGLGNAAAAVSEGQKGMALQPTSEDPFEGPEREERMAQIYALLGNADEAIPIIKRLLHISSPTGITPELMRIDPIWDPIRNDLRFQELVAKRNRELVRVFSELAQMASKGSFLGNFVDFSFLEFGEVLLIFSAPIRCWTFDACRAVALRRQVRRSTFSYFNVSEIRQRTSHRRSWIDGESGFERADAGARRGDSASKSFC
jgi:tetratricopeptide (TPR) repeat protein